MKPKLEHDFQNILNNKEMKEIITPNRVLGFYFVMPIVIGMILIDGMDIDVSTVVREHVGLFRFLEDAGRNIKTKSMIFLIYLLFSPFAWFYYAEHRRRTQAYAQAPFQRASIAKLLVMVIGVLLGLSAAFLVFVIGPHKSALTSRSPGIQAILGSSHWDISFGIFVGVIWLGIIGMLFGLVLGINEIIRRLNH